ncbi:hypothetical protein B0H14DRAFT_2570893 [Mycena olivaceomarginata]|nr:hypothetical protein B0H14DRAFT_2570893 [Mycena olivaceomarginata]
MHLGIDANFTIYERPWGENYERHWGLPSVDSSSRLPLPQCILLRDRHQIRARLRELRLYAADFNQILENITRHVVHSRQPAPHTRSTLSSFRRYLHLFYAYHRTLNCPNPTRRARELRRPIGVHESVVMETKPLIDNQAPSKIGMPVQHPSETLSTEEICSCVVSAEEEDQLEEVTTHFPPTAMNPLAGSSSGNPWTLDDKGRLFLQNGKFGENLGRGKGSPCKSISQGKGSPRKLQIFGGPPSTIRRDTRTRPPHPPHPAASAAAPSKAKMRIQYTYGKRARRDIPLTANDLYLDDARPPSERPPSDAPLAGNRNKCGHSYCYVCIRLRLEEHWTCPRLNCNRTIRKAPTINVGEAETVEADYLDRVDKSQVSYSWEGLSFPFRNKSIWVPSSP